MGWLQRAQRPGGGFSAAFSWLGGWGAPYPETTGYIIESLVEYASRTREARWMEMSLRAGEWLLDIQLPNGAFPGGSGRGREPRVFNTGMILLGLHDLFVTTNDERYRKAALRTLEWLRGIQEPDGSWRRASLGNTAHAYQSGVAWGILKMADALKVSDRYADTVRRANDWVLSQETGDGWYQCNELPGSSAPITHTIAYAARGLLECGARLRQEKWLAGAVRTAEACYEDWIRSGSLAAAYGRGWARGPDFRCVTGEAQIGLIWYRVWQLTKEPHWLEAAEGIALQVAQTQSLRHPLPGIRGAIPGSWPIWGAYVPFGYPNWAAKFYVDLLMALHDE